MRIRHLAPSTLALAVLCSGVSNAQQAGGKPPAPAAPTSAPASAAPPASPRGGAPPPMTNLQFYPKDTPRQQVVQSMRAISMALGVGCEFCHVEHEPPSTEPDDFATDARLSKKQARAMLVMTKKINDDLLAAFPDRSTPPVRVECVTCHRGSQVPKTLGTVLRGVLAREGTEAVAAKYLELKKDANRGRFDFGEGSLNDLARSLTDEGKTTEALAILRLNAEQYPDSGTIPFLTAETHAKRGEKDLALAMYKKALEKNPGNERIRRRIDDLQKPPAEKQP